MHRFTLSALLAAAALHRPTSAAPLSATYGARAVVLAERLLTCAYVNLTGSFLG